MKEIAHGEPIVIERPVVAQQVIGFPSRRSKPRRLHVVMLDASLGERACRLVFFFSSALAASPQAAGCTVNTSPRKFTVDAHLCKQLPR